MSTSIPMPSRDVRRDWVATPDLYPSDTDDVLEMLAWDPYALGTVFASLVWDLREATDPDTTLSLLVETAVAWGEEGDLADVDRFAVILVERAQDVAPTEACDALALHFPDVDGPSVCGS